MLGENIKTLRSSLGWSQVDLAKKLNITKQTVSNWENENIQPSIEMLVRLSRIFGVTTDFLLGLERKTNINVIKIEQIIRVMSVCSKSIKGDRVRTKWGRCFLRKTPSPINYFFNTYSRNASHPSTISL